MMRPPPRAASRGNLLGPLLVSGTLAGGFTLFLALEVCSGRCPTAVLVASSIVGWAIGLWSVRLIASSPPGGRYRAPAMMIAIVVAALGAAFIPPGGRSDLRWRAVEGHRRGHLIFEAVRVSWSKSLPALELHAPAIADEPASEWPWRVETAKPPAAGVYSFLVTQPNWSVLDENGSPYPGDGLDVGFLVSSGGSWSSVMAIRLDAHHFAVDRRWRRVAVVVPDETDALAIAISPGPLGSHNWNDRVYVSPDRFLPQVSRPWLLDAARSVNALALLFVLVVLAATVRRLASSKKGRRWLLAMGAAGVAIVLVEAVLRLVVPATPLRLEFPEGYFGNGPGDLTLANPGTHRVKEYLAGSGELLYDVTYTISDRFIRVSALEGCRGKRFLLFLGDSLTFGWGLEDAQTLPARLCRRLHGHTPYNYAFQGNGTFDVLARLESIDPTVELAQDEGVVLYLFIDDHIRRSIGSFRVAQWNYQSTHYERSPDGALVRTGSLSRARPILTGLARLLSGSRLLSTSGFEFPLRISDGDLDLIAEAVASMSDRIEAWPRQTTFALAIYPGSQYGPALARRLVGHDVVVLDYSDLFDPLDPRFILHPQDSHPSALAIDLLALQLARDLERLVAANDPTVR